MYLFKGMKMADLQSIKDTLINEIETRVKEKILESTNAKLLTKLINKADSIQDAYAIAMLGTTYKATGFHFDKRLEKESDTLHYLKKDEMLSFIDPRGGDT